MGSYSNKLPGEMKQNNEVMELGFRCQEKQGKNQQYLSGIFFFETFPLFFDLSWYCSFKSSRINCAVLNCSVDRSVRISTLGNLESAKNLKNDEDVDFFLGPPAYYLTYVRLIFCGRKLATGFKNSCITNHLARSSEKK